MVPGKKTNPKLYQKQPKQILHPFVSTNSIRGELPWNGLHLERAPLKDLIVLFRHVYINIYIYIHAHTCKYVYVYICIYVYMYICIYVYMYICMYVWMDGWMYVCMYICMYVCNLMYVM